MTTLDGEEASFVLKPGVDGPKVKTMQALVTIYGTACSLDKQEAYTALREVALNSPT
jgi:hypothetical protein